jgi:hypothetical protein
MDIKHIKTGAALWQLSQLLSESDNELWLDKHIDMFFLPLTLGGTTCILSIILSEEAVFGIDLKNLQGGVTIPIKKEYHEIPIYSLMKKPIDQIILTESDMYNTTAKTYITSHNINNIIQFLRSVVKIQPKNAHERFLKDYLVKKSFNGSSFLEYIDMKD